MRATLPYLLACLTACGAQAAPYDAVLVNRGQAAPLPPPRSDAHPVGSIVVGSAPGLTPRIVAQWQRSDLVPFQSWLDLPTSVVGIVWMAGPQPWGAGYEHSATPSLQASRDEYKFGVDGTSPCAVYFESDGRGFNYLRHWTGGGRGSFNAAMFNARTPNAWGLTRRAHIVEVDVNARQGAPAGIHFVVTNARVLDDTSVYPPRADEVLVALRARFDAVLEDEQPELDGLYASAVRNVGGSYVFGPPTAVPVGVFPTWRRDAQAIEVVFTSGRSGVGQGRSAAHGTEECPPCPPGAPCMECNPGRFQITQTATVKVGYAIRYRVDARGLVVTETRYAGRAETSLGESRSGSREGDW